jgi:tetratricopeptide (TPR) repeat protein
LSRWPAAVLAAALAVLGIWQAVRPARADWHIQRASDSLAVGQVQEGLRRLGQAAGLVPWLPEPWVLAASQITASGQPQISFFYYRRALTKDPRSFPATFNAARSAVAIPDPANAQKYYERAIELDPNAIELKIEASTSYLSLGLSRPAQQRAQDAVEQAPDNALAWKALGEAQRGLGHDKQAIAALRRSVALDPNGGAQPTLDELLGRAGPSG